MYIVNLSDILALADGPEKTAELVAWIQGLYASEPPTLVGQVFVEFPGEELEAGESSVELKAGRHRLRVLAPEALLADRLAAWKFWKSTTDAVNAFLVLPAVGDRLEERALLNLVKQREIEAAWESLSDFARRYSDSEPTAEEMVQWAESEEF